MSTIVVAIIKNSKGQFLATSRKNDHTSFGLPGGKVEDKDRTLFQAISREVKEETGLTLKKSQLVSNREYKGEMTYAFLVDDYIGKVYTDEEAIAKGEGLVRWLELEDLSFGFCGDYNNELLSRFK